MAKVKKSTDKNERKLVSVMVTDYVRGSLEGKLTDVISALQKLVLEVPAEYRDSAYLEHDEEREYYGDSVYQQTVLYYKRPETDEELAARIAKDEEYKRQIYERDLQTYKALQAKFEGKPSK